MKNICTACFIIITLFTSSFSSFTASGQSSVKSDSVVMAPGYANEIYYSLENGAIQTGPRATWDIAFRTMKRSSSILTNDGAGVVLYTYPKADTSGWASVDTAGLSAWTPMYNDPADWENGAFMRNALLHPDYGWCRYNEVTHDLTGDSLFVIKLRDGSFRKLWMIKKFSAQDIYTFRYAKIDGSEEHHVTEDVSSLIATDFSGYSLQTNERVAFQPVRSSWDILFTKYMSVQSNGTPYLVTGVLSHDTVSSKNFHPVPLDYTDFGAGVWDSARSSIGWDWKYFDNINFVYHIVDSSVYFIKPVKGDIYKLYFTAFAGSSTGLIKFNLEKSAGAGISANHVNDARVTVYPNPATTKINLLITAKAGESLSFVLTDLSGRQLRADRPRTTDGLNAYSMDVTGVQPGIYFVTVSIAATTTVTKVIITR